MLLDHPNRCQWVRVVRQDISSKKADSIDQSLMAKAAFQMQGVRPFTYELRTASCTNHSRTRGRKQRPPFLLWEIYAPLDKPDGMEGISTLILLSPSLEHHIRQLESTGRWTSALRLQESPDNVNFHLGLLRCLLSRNLGHYGKASSLSLSKILIYLPDTFRTHARGVLARHETILVNF